MSSGTLFKPVVVALAIAAACTPAYLLDERRDLVVPRDRTVLMQGMFCTPAPGEVLRPIKILLAMDASQSMRVTDPEGTRAKAVVDLLDHLPQEKEIQFAVMLFAGDWQLNAALRDLRRRQDDAPSAHSHLRGAGQRRRP